MKMHMKPILVALALAGAFLLALSNVRAHDDATWIQEQGIRNKAGEWCCGKGDCERLKDGDVVPAPGGLFIKSFNEHVPQSETIPFSQEGYWRCHRPDGSRRCLVIPPSGY